MSDVIDPLVGTQLGPCMLEALVGIGGMGRVYRARHLALERRVAVKLLDAQGEDAVARRDAVLAEARTAAKLDDPRVVAIHDVGEDRGLPYIVMQWVDGESLETRVKRVGPLPVPEALAIMREVALALKAAHAAGLVHRDVKPANILVDLKGAVKLTDFGIARSAGQEREPGEQIAGSFHFMAPEQAQGAAPDPRNDLYALGATWCYALSALPPYPGPAAEALTHHRDSPPPDVRARRPEVTEKAGDLLRRLMAKRPEDRPRDAEAVVQELSAVGMLLNTDMSGSPFRILPAPPRPEPRSDVPTPVRAEPSPTVRSAPAVAAPPPLPPSPPPAQEGSRTAFSALLGGLGLLTIGWQWRRAGPEDWAAGALLFAALPAVLTFERRWPGARRGAGGAAAAAALACAWAAAKGPGGPVLPALESAIAAALAVCALAGALYLGLWGTDASERAWGRALAPLAGLGLVLATAAWSVPEGQSWAAAVGTALPRWWRALQDSGAGWRWGGSAATLAALWGVQHLRTLAR